MTESKYIAELRRLVREQQQVQKVTPPSSEAGRAASIELARLGELLNVSLRHSAANVRFANARTRAR